MKLYADLFAAGHHTTLQHANFVFVLDNVSRLAIWSFFHGHPFYNSEQVSQRYREVTGETMATPDLPAADLVIYEAAIARALAGYRRLAEILAPDMAARYGQVFPARAKAANGPEASAASPKPCRSGRRKSPVTSCLWPLPPTSTTPSMG